MTAGARSYSVIKNPHEPVKDYKSRLQAVIIIHKVNLWKGFGHSAIHQNENASPLQPNSLMGGSFSSSDKGVNQFLFSI